jgi:hypothetical protein
MSPGGGARVIFEEAGVPPDHLDAMVRMATDLAPYAGGSEWWAAVSLIAVLNAYDDSEKGADPP